MDLAALRTQQQQLVVSVERADRLDRDPPVLIGDVGVGFEQEGEVARAVMVLLTRSELELVEYQVTHAVTIMPYIPGFLSSHETPALLVAWEQLSQKPSLFFVDGHGISYLWRLGVADHFGLMIDVPTTGVAKRQLCGKIGEPGDEPGVLTPLMDKDEQPAWVWRSEVRCNPLFISTGHRVGMDSAPIWVERCMRGYRLPEPTHWVDVMASCRSPSVCWQANHG